MQSKEKDNLIFVRLFPGEKIYSSLREVCKKHQVRTAVAVSGLGQLGEFELGYFKEKGNYTPQRFSQPHELLSLVGNAYQHNNDYEFHLHAVLGNQQKIAVGGHLISGVVSITAEIILLKTDLEIKRKIEPKTGLRELSL